MMKQIFCALKKVVLLSTLMSLSWAESGSATISKFEKSSLLGLESEVDVEQGAFLLKVRTSAGILKYSSRSLDLGEVGFGWSSPLTQKKQMPKSKVDRAPNGLIQTIATEDSELRFFYHNRLLVRIEANGKKSGENKEIIRFEYDENDNLSQIQTPRGVERQHYDSGRDVLLARELGSCQEVYDYDSQLKNNILSAQVTTTFKCNQKFVSRKTASFTYELSPQRMWAQLLQKEHSDEKSL